MTATEERKEIFYNLAAINYEFEEVLVKIAKDLKVKMLAKTDDEVVIRITAPDAEIFGILTNAIFRAGYRLSSNFHFSPDYAWTYYAIFTRLEWDEFSLDENAGYLMGEEDL